MNVLILAQNYPPSVSGGSIAAQKLCRSIASIGHGVTVITTTNHHLKDGDVIYRHDSGCHVIDCKVNRKILEIPFSILKRISHPQSRLNHIATVKWYKLYGIRFAKHIRKQILDKSEKFDLILSICYPFYNHVIASILSKMIGIPWRAIYFDPFFSSHYYSFGDKRDVIESFEREVLSTADRICVLPCEEKDYISLLGASDYRLRCFNYPIQFPDVYFQSQKHENERHIFLHAGTIYKNTREPRVLFSIWKQYIQKTGYQDELILIGRIDGYSKRELDIIKNTDASIRFLPPVPHDVIQEYYHNADVLVALGSSMLNQFTSKLNDYMSTGKPIIYTAAERGDSEIQVLSLYKSSIIAYPDITEDSSNVIDKMVRLRNATESIPFNKDDFIDYSKDAFLRNILANEGFR